MVSSFKRSGCVEPIEPLVGTARHPMATGTICRADRGRSRFLLNFSHLTLQISAASRAAHADAFPSAAARQQRLAATCFTISDARSTRSSTFSASRCSLRRRAST